MTRYDVTLEWLDGRTETIGVENGQTVLEAAQQAGIRLPYDCRTGTCITCVGRVLEAEDGAADAAEGETGRSFDVATAVDYRRSPRALSERERADGYVLLCIALPRIDCRIRVGPRVRAEVGDSPWA
ncbi:2Fe-2S iron-sulfur cluster-binding protein [Natronorubrum sp. DTA7]|uniref:2Fe-2S iron-sulfur cluster-binding protein n=1 Tax=Natronorubrum sp. DTA7 TaxID=3447016 RepID=UPI003F879A83